MSPAGLAFASTGDPNSAIPSCPAYNESTRPTMVFDVQSHVVNDHRGPERQVRAALPGAKQAKVLAPIR